MDKKMLVGQENASWTNKQLDKKMLVGQENASWTNKQLVG